METFDNFVFVASSGLRFSIPLLLACIAGLWSERSGIVDVGLEGKMLVAAFAAASAAYYTGNAWLGLVTGIVASVATALIHGYACITERGNQIVSGVAINMMALGLTALLGSAWFLEGGRTPALSGDARFFPLRFPFVDELNGVPFLGSVYRQLFSGFEIITYFALAAVFVTWYMLGHTRFGLRIRAVGENPAAVDTGGMSVAVLRYQATLICGVLCGLAGSYLSVAQAAAFQPNMTAGKGFIALAALVFAKWKPIPALFTCILFGMLDAVAIRMQGMHLPVIGEVPVQFIQVIPYLLTLILLAGFIGTAVPPRASGIPYVKER
jgi:simple sugar transport system permease protein